MSVIKTAPAFVELEPHLMETCVICGKETSYYNVIEFPSAHDGEVICWPCVREWFDKALDEEIQRRK